MNRAVGPLRHGRGAAGYANSNLRCMSGGPRFSFLGGTRGRWRLGLKEFGRTDLLEPGESVQKRLLRRRRAGSIPGRVLGEGIEVVGVPASEGTDEHSYPLALASFFIFSTSAFAFPIISTRFASYSRLTLDLCDFQFRLSVNCAAVLSPSARMLATRTRVSAWIVSRAMSTFLRSSSSWARTVAAALLLLGKLAFDGHVALLDGAFEILSHSPPADRRRERTRSRGPRPEGFQCA